jgi:hypothetical protein
MTQNIHDPNGDGGYSTMGQSMLKNLDEISADLTAMRHDMGVMRGQMKDVARGVALMLELLIERERETGKDPVSLLDVRRDLRKKREMA